MANVKFSGLPTASSVATADLLCISQGGVSKSATVGLFTDDTAYTSAWNGITAVSPSKNAVYDQLHKIDTADDGSIISASTGFRIGGAAASGKILIGNGTNFVASTPTYPNASATTGKLLQSDGTNFVASTMTWPSGAAPTTGKILISDGTNIVASTPTYPNSAGGFAGRIITTTDGTNWSASAFSWPTAIPTNGKFLISNGVDMVGASVTYPSAASPTIGRIVISDGTNWVTSTPAYPNASATARKFIVSDGTNWVASTETQATPGASGNTLVSDGTNWVSEILALYNAKTSQQTLSTSDVYLAGSTITVAANSWSIGMAYRCVFNVIKTAGTGIIVITARIGTLGTTSDAVLFTFTMPAAGTAASDQGRFEVTIIIRTTGASATSVALINVWKNLTTTGLINTPGVNLMGSSGAGTAFNSTTATKIGVSFNGATNFAGTCDVLRAELKAVS